MLTTANSFVHLHLHTHYSLLDGFTRPKALVKRVKELGMPAVAITDHGNMHGAIELYLAALDAGIKPIIGLEAYVAPGDRRDRSRDAGTFGEASFHLVLLAENARGYRNLLALTSESYRTGFYYKPRVDKALLREHAEGVIALSGHLGTEIAAYLERGDTAGARRAAEEMRDIFGPSNFFIEMQDHGDAIQKQMLPQLAEIAEQIGVGLAANNDAHFLNEDDHDAHDILLCIATGKKRSDHDRLRYSRELYVKSPEQMRALFARWPQACDNTLRIAERCNVSLNLDDKYPPAFPIPLDPQKGKLGADEYLRALADDGVEWRYGFTRNLPDATNADGVAAREVFERLDKELAVISAKRFSEYFLIVNDFVSWARTQSIPAGARGSGVGTMVGYVLGLSHVCPITYGLLFERFMDPSRSDYPDIDIDMCQDGREKVIDYVRDKYKQVCQIVTFMTLGAKAAIKDVCRVLDLPVATANFLSNLVPNTPKITLAKALEQNPDFKACYDGTPSTELTERARRAGAELSHVREVIDLAQRIEGLARNPGVHAAGVVIADRPLEQFVPLLWMDRKEAGATVRTLVTQYDGPTVERAGLLKMDFLGLKTLSVIELTRQLVLNTTGRQLELSRVDLTDQKVFEVFRQGRTQGFFQFESGGMQDVLIKMRPDRIEDLIAANALYRPGPMELIPLYCERKHGAAFDTDHPIIAEVCANTYGIMVYQEQVMQIFNRLGGIELGKAYKLIKAISKKKQAEIDAMKPKFIEGAKQNGLNNDQAEDVFSKILKFAGYGFNKSHSAGYALVAYQTAYLKTYYPVQFMAATLTYEARSGKIEDIGPYIEEARKIGIPVLAPDINTSGLDFTVVPAKNGYNAFCIRFGLQAIKGVGRSAVEEIIRARDAGGPFKNIFDFAERVDPAKVNSGCVESLIKAGAFDATGAMRRALFESIERVIQIGQDRARDRKAGQSTMFDMFGGDVPTQSVGHTDNLALPRVEWTESEMLEHEKSVLSLYVTKHPLAQHEAVLERYATARIADIQGLAQEAEVILGGIITRVKETIAKKSGKKMAFVTLSDLSGSIDVTVFPSTFAADGLALQPDKVVFVRGRVDHAREQAGVLAERIIGIDISDRELCEQVRVTVDAFTSSADALGHVRQVLGEFKADPRQSTAKGTRPGAEVLLSLRLGDSTVKRYVLMRCGGLRVRAESELVKRMETLPGVRCEFRGPPRRNLAVGRADVPVAKLTTKAADYDAEQQHAAVHRWG